MSNISQQSFRQDGSSADRPQQEKILACKRCQYKKLKCSKTTPCNTCQKAAVPCEYRQVDRKRRPASQDHVTILQNRIAWLEDFIVDMQSSSSPDRDEKLRNIHFASAPSKPRTPAVTQHHATSYRTSNLRVNIDGFPSFHGPTSIYHEIREGRLESTQQGRLQESAFNNADHVLRHFDIDLNSDIITQTLLLFFKWQYPNYVFIYRDAFLREHYGERQGGKYWSISLLLSICSLASSMLPESGRGNFGTRCHDAAVSIAIVADLTHPSITAVQTFLCLAFCEIGCGNLSKGWAFSGIAFRMAQDLGFQKDPETWASLDASSSTNEDVEVRRRIYWGCYISDKLISLVFGRPVQLLYNEAEVHDLATRPDPAFIYPWRSVGFDDDAFRQYTDISMIPYVKEQIRLARIVERMLSLMSSNSDKDISVQRPKLDSLNQSLLQWRTSLPEWAEFKSWDLSDQPLKPSTAAIHLIYNATRIALNFNEAVLWERGDLINQAREACTLAVTEMHSIVRRFRKQHGLNTSPFIMIYALAQAVRASRAFGTTEETKNLIKSLSECSTTWSLANMIVA